MPFTLETLPKVGNRLVGAESVTGMTVVGSEDGPEPPGRSEDETARPPERRLLPVRLKLRSAALMAMTAVAIPLVWGVLSAGSKVASTEASSAWDGGDNLRALQECRCLVLTG